MIEDIKEIKFVRWFDERGSGFKFSGTSDFESNEIYISKSGKNVIRGMHFQPHPYEQKKAIFVVKGSITGVVADLRLESPTFREISVYNLSDEDERGILYTVTKTKALFINFPDIFQKM